MNPKSGQPQLEFRRLDSAYRDSWERFCAEVAVLQSLSQDRHDDAALESARNRVENAESRYRENRDKLAEYMIGNTSGRSARAAQRTDESSALPTDESDATTLNRSVRLNRLAYQFWEEGGRREGNAEADWDRAEASLGT